MNIKGSTVLVTGANRGIGKAFVAGLLERGAAKIYLAARDPASLANALSGCDTRLVPLQLDVTNPADVANAAASATDVSLLINNAGYAAFQGAIAHADLTEARREMEVNYFGPLALTRAFAPILATAGGGTIVNMLSMVALVSLPVCGTYSASKAAFLSATRSIRAQLVGQGTIVVGILAVQTETELGASLPEPRLTPAEVVSDALDAVEAGRSEEVPAGSLTQRAYKAFNEDPKAFQARMATMLPRSA